MQPDAEHQRDDHQRDDADFGRLGGEFPARDEARRERADGDARRQIFHERLDARPVGRQDEGVGEHQAPAMGAISGV